MTPFIMTASGSAMPQQIPCCANCFISGEDELVGGREIGGKRLCEWCADNTREARLAALGITVIA